MKKYFLILSISVFIFSCKKKDNEIIPEETSEIIDTIPVVKIDTAEIGPYFPVYPKSIWIYINNKQDTITHKTDSGYIYLPAYWTNGLYPYSPKDEIDKNPCYATRYDLHPVKKYNFHTNYISQYTSGWSLLLPNKIYKGNYYASQYLGSATYLYRNIDVVDTSIVVNNVKYDSVLVVRTIHGYDKSNLSLTYYAKHVGIIRVDEFTDSVTTAIKESLISYKIGKK